MIDLAQEEMSHFKMVHQLIKKRGYTLGKQRPDYYVRDLLTFFPKGGSREIHLVHRLLYAGLIEARSCERFRLLSEHLNDHKLKTFYKKLMISEANHYVLFLKLAKIYASPALVKKKWQALLVYEAEIMKKLGEKENIHG